MPIPDYQALMLPLLKRLALSNGAVAVRSFVDDVAEEFSLTDEERLERIPSGTENLLANRLAWARTYMGKAGLLSSPKRGLVEITQEGRDLIAENPAKIDNETLGQYPAFIEWLTQSRAGRLPKERSIPDVAVTPNSELGSPERQPDLETPLEMIDRATSLLSASLRNELLERVRQMSPAEFEGLILRLLLAMGYGSGLDEMAKALGKSSDGGVDGVIHQDPLGLERVYVQAKRYREGNGVSSPDIRNFVGALNIQRATKGVFVTASHFTTEAQRAADGTTLQVVLIDGKRLADLMLRHGVGVIVRSIVEIKEVDEGFFAD
jgi:restriction system protein